MSKKPMIQQPRPSTKPGNPSGPAKNNPPKTSPKPTPQPSKKNKQ